MQSVKRVSLIFASPTTKNANYAPNQKLLDSLFSEELKF
jgi:hypothetical protein